MILVAIIGILTIIALPSYGDYKIKIKVAEAIQITSACKYIISEEVEAGFNNQSTINTCFQSNISDVVCWFQVMADEIYYIRINFYPHALKTNSPFLSVLISS